MADTDINLVPAPRLAAALHQILSDGGEQADQLLALFGPTCDCDVAVELRQRINDGDTALIAIIRDKIKPLVIAEPEILTTPL